jgi:hypothetical protein
MLTTASEAIRNTGVGLPVSCPSLQHMSVILFRGASVIPTLKLRALFYAIVAQSPLKYELRLSKLPYSAYLSAVT